MPPERPNIPDYYQVLGIGFGATQEEVRIAWRESVKRWHPDRNPNDPHAAERMREVNEAREVLCKPESRATYNRNYFILQAAVAEAEREEHEQERLRAERQEALRRQAAARRRREEAAARKRQEEAESRRRNRPGTLRARATDDFRRTRQSRRTTRQRISGQRRQTQEAKPGPLHRVVIAGIAAAGLAMIVSMAATLIAGAFK